MPECRDRNDDYVPEGLYLSGRPHFAELGDRYDDETETRIPTRGQIAGGLADEMNRESHWQWADVSGDGTHWAHFNGHRVQIDVAFSTKNERKVSHWKGVDEIRAAGVWTLSLNRQQCWEGCIGSDPLASMRKIPDVIEKMLDHSGINWFDETPAAEQLVGRRVYYDRTPAVISSASVLHQGAVMIRPVGMEFFPRAFHSLDDDEFPDDPYDRREIKADLLSPYVWWWRRKSYGDEPVKPPKSEPIPVEGEVDA